MKVPEQLQFLVNARAPQHRSDARMDGSVVVITGATSGVGYQAARRFAAGGARLVLVCRNREKADRLRAELATEFGSAVSCVIADFSRLAEVRAAGAQILAENSAIDVLIQPLLKDPAISAEALYHLAAAPKMAGVSGRFFNQTIDEKPAAHALDRVLGRAVWDLSERLVGISDPAGPNAGSAS